MQLNYLLDAGAFIVRPDGTFAVDPAKIKDGVAALTREIMTIQAEGNYAKAKEMAIDSASSVRRCSALLDKLTERPSRYRAALCHRRSIAERESVSAPNRERLRPAVFRRKPIFFAARAAAAED